MKPSRIVLLAALLTFASVPAVPQQQPAGAATQSGPGRGGGFTQPDPIDFGDNAGWKSMFDGETLNGWDGNLQIWHVENGTIVAESTCEKPTGTTYLIWQRGQPGDFELKAELRGEGAGINSGIQYRSFIQAPMQGRGGGPGDAGAARPGGRGRGPSGPCPSGQPRGVPDIAANAKWNLG